MQIAVQPPSKTVYQRILKPFPSVYLILPPLHTNVSGDPLSLLYEALSAKSHEEGVFVEASVVRNDNGDPLDRAIDGQATARLERSGWNSGVYTATFKKLKLLTTSQQRSGSKFSLCFRLKCSSLALGSLADMVVISNPIEVFSHSQYLGKSDDDRAKTQPGAIKYADNPAGLHLKLMESIHAFKELGGAQETLINYITAIYNQNNPIPSAMVALPPSGLPHVHPQQLPEGFVLQHHQAILPSTGERSQSPTGTIFGGTPPNVSPRSSFHSAALPQQPSFPLTPTPRRCSPTSSGSSSPPSSPPTLFAAPPATHAPVPMSVPPHPRASPALFPSGSGPASVPLTPQTAASVLPGIASLLASSGVSLPPLASSATPAPVPSSLSDPTARRRPSVETLLQQPVHADHLRGGSSLLSSLLLAPLQALSEACRDRTNSSKRKAKESGHEHEHEHDQRRRAADADDLGEKEKREVRHKRRRKSAD